MNTPQEIKDIQIIIVHLKSNLGAGLESYHSVETIIEPTHNIWVRVGKSVWVKDFDSRLKDAGRHLVVVHFWASWAEQCKQMKDVFVKLAKEYPNTAFLNLEAEEIPEISEKYEIEAVPTFIFIKCKQKIGRMNGADVPVLKNLVKQYLDAVPPPLEESSDPETILNNRLRSLVSNHPCMLFMKGNRDEPRCGFSRQMISILNEHNCDYKTFDILEDEQVRQGLKVFSEWPTYPQLYVKGELIGGLDIIKDMVNEGELKNVLPQTKTLNQRIEEILNRHKIMLFMKGDPTAPRCGFSRQIVDILNATGVKYSHFDILSDEEIRQGLKKYSDWPTYPQLYVSGELIGGLDVIKEMKEAEELKDALEG